MAILRGFSPARSVELAERAWDLGIGLVEVPVQSQHSLVALAAVVEAGARRGRSVGAGTVVSTAQLEQVSAMGATFAVSPGFDIRLVESAAEQGLAYLPGVGSATDIQLAAGAGVTHLKAFPAGVLGPNWFRAMRGPFPDVVLVATGGIDAASASQFLAAGAAAVAVGSALEDDRQLSELARLVQP